MNQASTTTITEESANRNQNFLTASPIIIHNTDGLALKLNSLITIHNTDGLALKLNSLKEKSTSYVSYKNFITQCINSKLVLKRLELTFEQTIGHYDQDNWYSNLKDFSLVLMEQIISFCDKTIEETTIKINDTKMILKQQLEKKQYEEITKTITLNEAAAKKILHQGSRNTTV